MRPLGAREAARLRWSDTCDLAEKYNWLQTVPQEPRDIETTFFYELSPDMLLGEDVKRTEKRAR